MKVLGALLAAYAVWTVCWFAWRVARSFLRTLRGKL